MNIIDYSLRLLLTRRRFILGTLSALALATTIRVTRWIGSARAATADKGVLMTPGPVNVRFKVNGQAQELKLDSRTTLLDALREHIHLTGTKKGCDHGQCGACTVIVNGRRINSCLTLAAMQDGADITTIEGLGSPEHLHPLQSAFIAHDGFQCGYCTPGQICSAVGMISELKEGMPSYVTASLTAKPEMTEDEIRERMSGNLCRCAAYPNIVAAIKEAGQAA